ncbi:MAG TPA: MOSC domain-containing protein [Terriglobales bacterium]|nr:MOSC domain-containing protein [Terriglobales bacterium]
MRPGKIISIHIAPRGGASMQSLTKASAIAARGLEGDRYRKGVGTYSDQPGSGRALTLIESEAMIALKREYNVDMDAALARRNLVTEGVALNHLVERNFRVGEVILRGTRLCEPYAHLERLTRPGTLRGLIHRGGLRAEILSGGAIQVGDDIVLLDE